MRVWRREEDFDLPSCVVALGTFDGVHIGHQALIRRAMELARELDTACVVYTFRNHPLSVLCPERAPEALLQKDEKLSKLSALGVRVETDLRNEKIGYKIREAQMQKLPYMLVVGDKEAEAGTVSVRTRGGVDLGAMPVDEFAAKITEEIRTRAK